ncbi:MAG: fumarylacetoacetate hydrolase family protein [Deltaproteobacteria bacterium]|nr:fumarylacetoacetate hydrolase family protein [Deltaproteobacteria bacterium]
MKLVLFRKGKEISLGIVLGEQIIDLNAGFTALPQKPSRLKKIFPMRDMKTFWENSPATLLLARKLQDSVKKGVRGKVRGPAAWGKVLLDMSQVKLLAPITNPPKIICLARNYVSHAREVAGDTPLPTSLLPFMKPTPAIVGPGDFVMMSSQCRKLDHEVKLAVVIGRKGRYIPEEEAMDHVGGYTILNDISDREYIVQKETHRVNWFFMKAQDTFAPMGPALVLRDEIEDPHRLRLRLWVNGELRQDSSGEDMIFRIPSIISILSRYVTLEPGDVIATGTPTGTSFSTNKFLRDGDVVECEIEGIGRLKNVIKVENPIYRTF